MSGYPPNVSTESEKKLYCSTVNEKCGFSGNLSITTENVCKNDAKRASIKAAMNSLVGRMGMKPIYNNIEYIYSYSELVKLFWSEKSKITSLNLVGQDVAKVVLENKTSRGHRSTNVIISAYVTSLCR